MKLFIRIILSPLIFIYGLTLIAAGLLLPITLIAGISLFTLIGYPFVWLINTSIENKIVIEDAFFSPTKYKVLNHLLTVTIPLWGAFVITYLFIVKGKLYKID